MVQEFACDAPDCAFQLRSHDTEEIIEIVQRHARQKHDRTVDGDRIRSRIVSL